MNLRRAAPGDAEEIARLASELGYPATPQDIASRLSVLLPLPTHFIAVAERSGSLLGFVAAERRMLLESGERAELVGLVVGAADRRAGIGRALVNVAEEWARALGLAIISVRSNILRLESHPFYESIGYARTKTQHAYAKQLSAGVRVV